MGGNKVAAISWGDCYDLPMPELKRALSCFGVFCYQIKDTHSDEEATVFSDIELSDEEAKAVFWEWVRSSV